MPKRPLSPAEIAAAASRKKVKTGGRTKGTPNKTSIPKAAERLIQAREMARTPAFKAWERMRRLAAELDAELARIQAEMVVELVEGELQIRQTPASATYFERLHAAQDRLMEALKVLLPYEKPRLTATKVSGDRSAPLFDLSGLSEAELKSLRSIILKSQQVQETDDAS